MGPFEVQLDVVFPGDRDATVQLDRLARDGAKCFAGRQSGQCGRDRGGPVDRLADDSTCRLYGHIHVGHPMLEGLEASNRPTELYALFGVVNREFQAAGRSPDLLRGQQDHRDVFQSGVGADHRR